VHLPDAGVLLEAPDLPDPAEEIARQRVEGKKLILVQVPWEIEDET
jgi:hypothetical protein